MSTSEYNKIIRDFAQSLKGIQDSKPTPYDTQAKVIRVEDDIAWVHIDGGVDETPVQLTTSAKKGDVVQVRISGGNAWLYGNQTAPPTDDTMANVADDKAEKALYEVELIDERVIKATERITEVEGDITDLEGRVDTAEDNISAVEGDISALDTRVDTAEGNITTIEGDISALDTRVDAAEGDITTIEGDITTLQTRVTDAEEDIDDTLEGLALAQDIVGTLAWITSHATQTTDTTPVSGKSYYIKNQDNTFSLVTDTTGKNPYQEGWYELDDAMGDFVNDHLVLTLRGLWVLPSGMGNESSGREQYAPGYKILISPGSATQDAGTYIYDGSGHLVTSYNGDGIDFDEDNVFHIGSEDAYILFTPESGQTSASITIGGNVTLGSNKTLSEMLAAIDIAENTLLYDHDYSYSSGVYTFTAYLYRGGIDVKSLFDPEQFTWFYKTEDGAEMIPLTNNLVSGNYENYGYTITISDSTHIKIEDFGYGGHVIGHFVVTDDSELLTEDDDNLTNDLDQNYTARTQSGDSVRVSDLTVATTLYSSDKLMVVGSEDEHLVTVQTIQDYLNVNLEKQVLFNTTAAWNAQAQLQSKANTLYVYTDHMVSGNDLIAGIKVGDGNAYLIDLPFTDEVFMDHISNTHIHITDQERLFWNNKVSVYYGSNETAIFTTGQIT